MKKEEFMKDFINQWLGRALDIDGAYGVQCVDGAKIGLKILGGNSAWNYAIGDAIAYWTNTSAHPWLSANTTRITNINDLNVGDLVIMSTPSPTGHICWYAGDGMVFGQNQSGRNDAFSLRPISNWTFAGALRYTGFDDFSEPVHGGIGADDDMTHEYEAANFNDNFNSAYNSRMEGTMWRSNQTPHVYFPVEN